MAKIIGSLSCTFGGLRQDFSTGEMELVLKLDKDEKNNAKLLADSARGVDLTLTLEKRTKKRSLDSNSYFWQMAGRV